MSCSSPFLYQEGLTISSTSNCVVSGGYELPGYSYSFTVPSACVPGWVCNWCGWRGWGTCCSWSKCAFVTPSYMETITMWPTINISASTTIPITITSSAGIQFTDNSPETPYIATTVSAGNFTITGTVNETNISVPVYTDNIQLEQNNDEFSLNIPLVTLTNTVTEDIDGIEISYTITVTPLIQFCLDPEPPVGWINLLLQCTLSASDPTIDYTYNVNFAVSLPIVSVEEGGE